MQIEYEATFSDIDKDEIRGRLKSVGAELVKPEFMQKRFLARSISNTRKNMAFQKKLSTM